MISVCAAVSSVLFQTCLTVIKLHLLVIPWGGTKHIFTDHLLRELPIDVWAKTEDQIYGKDKYFTFNNL